MIKVIVSHSGGMDSTALLGMVLETRAPDEVLSVGFKYPSKHNPYELEMAEASSEHYGVKRRVIDASSLMADFKSDLLTSGGKIPEGHYTDASMSATVVPCRNLIFASILAGLADSLKAEVMALGIHAGDHAIYPDCRAGFKAKLTQTIWEATDNRVTLITPFLRINKAGILQRSDAFKTKVPWHLTRTCYKAQPTACGKCGSCVERLEAFKEVGQVDPLTYDNDMF